MANPAPKPQPAPPTRLHVKDPETDAVIQDIYNKLNQIWAAINKLQHP